MRKIRWLAAWRVSAAARPTQRWLRLGAVLVALALLLPLGLAAPTPSFASHTSTFAAASSSAAALSLDATADVTATGDVAGGSFAPDGGLFFAAEEVVLTNTVNLNALTVVVTVQKTDGVTAGSQRFQSTSPVTLTQSESDNGSQIVYTYTLAPGQHLRAGSTLRMTVQINGTGSYHVFGGDAFTVNSISAGSGAATSLSGGFPPPAGLPPPPSGPPVIVAGIVDPGTSSTYGQEDVTLSNRVALTALTITITVDEADGPLFEGQYTTFSTPLATSNSDDGNHITYVYTFVPGLSSPVFVKGQAMAVAQFSLPANISHTFTNDSYEVSYTTSEGASADVTGSFPAGPPPPPPPPPSSVSNDFFAASGGGVDTGTPFYLNDVVSITNSAELTALTVAVTVRKTSGVTFGAQFNSFAAGVLTMSHVDTGSQIVYTYTLAPGQQLAPGNRIMQAQFNNASGMGRPIGDTFAITATSGSGVRTALGSFPPGLPPANTPTATSTPIPPAATDTPVPPPPPATDTPVPPPAAHTSAPPPAGDTPAPQPATSTPAPTATSAPIAPAASADASTPVTATSTGAANPPVIIAGAPVPPRPASTRRRSRSTPTRPAPACTVELLRLYRAVLTRGKTVIYVRPFALVDDVRRHGGTRPGVTSGTPLFFDDGHGTQLHASKTYSALTCGRLPLLALHGTALSGSAPRGRHAVSLRGDAFTLTLTAVQAPAPRHGHALRAYRLRLQIPRIHYDRTFTQLQGSVMPLMSALVTQPRKTAATRRQSRPAKRHHKATALVTATPPPVPTVAPPLATATAAPPPVTATPLPTATPSGPAIIPVAPLRLSAASVRRGGTLTAAVTLENRGATRITLSQVIIAGRPPGGTKAGGPYDDFGAVSHVTLQPGQSVTVRKSRRFTRADPVGSWFTYVTYETGDGMFHDASATVTFAVL